VDGEIGALGARRSGERSGGKLRGENVDFKTAADSLCNYVTNIE
jgi:hypothetical protein